MLILPGKIVFIFSMGLLVVRHCLVSVTYLCNKLTSFRALTSFRQTKWRGNAVFGTDLLIYFLRIYLTSKMKQSDTNTSSYILTIFRFLSNSSFLLWILTYFFIFCVVRKICRFLVVHEMNQHVRTCQNYRQIKFAYISD